MFLLAVVPHDRSSEISQWLQISYNLKVLLYRIILFPLVKSHLITMLPYPYSNLVLCAFSLSKLLSHASLEYVILQYWTLQCVSNSGWTSSWFPSCLLCPNVCLYYLSINIKPGFGFFKPCSWCCLIVSGPFW